MLISSSHVIVPGSYSKGTPITPFSVPVTAECGKAEKPGRLPCILHNYHLLPSQHRPVLEPGELLQAVATSSLSNATVQHFSENLNQRADSSISEVLALIHHVCHVGLLEWLASRRCCLQQCKQFESRSYLITVNHRSCIVQNLVNKSHHSPHKPIFTNT